MAASDHAGSDQAGPDDQASPGHQADRATHPVIAGVTELLPVLRQRAQEAEDARVVPAESVKALEETGFFRLLQPKSAGGLKGDGEVGGGYTLDGRWSFSSGCDHASWVLLGGIVTDDEGKPVDFCTFLLPASDYTIDDVWDTVGLRGTGSNDIVVDNAFVPAYRALSFTGVTKIACPGHQVNTGALYRIPFGSIFSYAITTPIIGMATGAYAAHVDYQRQRVRASYVGQRSAEDPFAQVRIAEAAALIDAAWLALERDM